MLILLATDYVALYTRLQRQVALQDIQQVARMRILGFLQALLWILPLTMAYRTEQHFKQSTSTLRVITSNVQVHIHFIDLRNPYSNVLSITGVILLIAATMDSPRNPSRSHQTARYKLLVDIGR
jgi:hypothetical protein